MSYNKWPEADIHQWYSLQPWLKGANFIPATAINQLEMWQEETFDAERIDLELGWAEDMGMNTMRVFLHDLCWRDDKDGFIKRINTFLDICQKRGIRPMMVLFDSVWHPFPKSGRQPEPREGVHNSGWVQSPGADGLTDPAQEDRLEEYVTGVVKAFANDERILSWDIWNEPDNENGTYGGNGEVYGAYLHLEPRNKLVCVERLLPKVFSWARAANPQQPLTAGIWGNKDWTSYETLTAIEKIQIDLSDFVSFHCYGPPDNFEQCIKLLQQYNRPLICTEWMARPFGNTFEKLLPMAKYYNVGMMNWGFVEGKSQTNLPWDSLGNPYINGRKPDVWFHDILYRDGTPYSRTEYFALKMLD